MHKALHKAATLVIAKECGIRIPAQFSLDDIVSNGSSAQASATGTRPRTEIRFPLVAKPANKSSNQRDSTRYFHSLKDLEQAIYSTPGFGPEWLLQEYCPGVGVGVDVLLWDGKLVAAFQHRRVKEYPSTGGVSVMSVSEPLDPKLLEASVRLLQRMGWHGPAMVEYRFDPETGSATLMEINGRFWGSLALATRAGVDFPYYLWQLSHNQRPSPLANYPGGVRMLWRAGDCLRMFGIAKRWRSGAIPFSVFRKAAAGFSRDFISRTPDAVWSSSDPRPALAEYWGMLLEVLRRVRAGQSENPAHVEAQIERELAPSVTAFERCKSPSSGMPGSSSS
jgi:predicted ATP-grasp superfamily ATP-dependent carboligase